MSLSDEIIELPKENMIWSEEGEGFIRLIPKIYVKEAVKELIEKIKEINVEKNDKFPRTKRYYRLEVFRKIKEIFGKELCSEKEEQE